MKNKKGFTLIELLAIIVILAIIAVITVPIILDVINKAKVGSITDSAYGYKDAIQKYNASMLAIDPSSEGIKGSYTVGELKTLGLEISGQEPSQGVVLLDKDGLSGCLKFDEYASYIYNNDVISTVKGKCPTEKLVTEGDGLYKSETEPGRFIYRGADPDNRIFLKENGTNNTLYRIVSYEPDGTIKVVRDEKLSSNMAFDERDLSDVTTGPRHNTDNTFCNYSGNYSGCNVWGNTDNTYYNGEVLNPEFKYRFYANNTINTLQEHSTNKGTVTTDSSLNTYLNETWLTSTGLSNYIVNHDFNVGGVYYTSYTGGDKGIVREKEEESLYTWNGKVGLLNITEYAESSTNPSCTSVYSNYYFNSDNTTNQTSNEWPCKYENYNYKLGYHQWSLSPYSSNRSSVWDVNSMGSFSNRNAYHTGGVRPAFYLKSEISLSGSGVIGDEYKIN